jgi:hypothetical protein
VVITGDPVPAQPSAMPGGDRKSRAVPGRCPEATWVVLADPEGNEFCLLRRHETLTD